MIYLQCAKKVMSDSSGLVDSVIRLVNSVLNLPDGQMNFFFRNSLYKGTVINTAHHLLG